MCNDANMASTVATRIVVPMNLGFAIPSKPSSLPLSSESLLVVFMRVSNFHNIRSPSASKYSLSSSFAEARVLSEVESLVPSFLTLFARRIFSS